MGQYYEAVNVDKKEVIHPWQFNSGSKLTEFSYIIRENGEIENDFAGTLTALLMDRWKGDRVYVVGDYAAVNTPEIDKDSPWWGTLAALYDEFDWLGTEDEAGHSRTLYSCCKRPDWKVLFRVMPAKAPRYLCNSITGEYIDLRSEEIMRKVWKNDDDSTVSIYPLPLLLAIGNGKGGGDYWSSGGACNVGYWVPYTKGIFFSDSIEEGYIPFDPGFEEH